MDAFTLAGVSMVSLRFWPERALSLCQVRTLTCASQRHRNRDEEDAQHYHRMMAKRRGTFHGGGAGRRRH